MKRALSVLMMLTLVGLLILGGCAQPAPTPTPAPSPAKPPAPAPSPGPSPGPEAKKWPTFITINSPPAGSQKVMVGLASLIKSELGVPATVNTAQLGPAEYARGVHRGEAEIALVSSDVAYDAFRGTGVFSSEGKLRLRQILLGAWNPILLMARTASGVKSVPDIRGKRFIYIAKTLPYYTQMGDALLEYHKMTRKDIVPLEMAAGGDVDTSLTAGTTDVGIRMASPGASFILQLVEATPITFIALTDAELDFIQQKHPFFGKYVLKGGTFKYQDKDLPCASNSVPLICREDLPDDFVYALCKVLLDTTTVDKPGRFMSFDTHAGGFTLASSLEKADVMAFHPGAIKYYKERGVWTSKLDEIQKRLLAEIK